MASKFEIELKQRQCMRDGHILKGCKCIRCDDERHQWNGSKCEKCGIALDGDFQWIRLKCLFGHKWNGCKCSRCGKVRDEQHDWDLCKGKCRCCKKTQDEQHVWNGCVCSVCGKQGHKWKGCVCEKCGKKIHTWKGCKCSSCGKVKDREHVWHGNECTCCGKKRSNDEVLKEEKSIANKLIHPESTLSLNSDQKRQYWENQKKALNSLTVQTIILDVALNAHNEQYKEIAAKKLTNHENFTEYLISKGNTLVHYKKSIEWKYLHEISDTRLLRKIAENAIFNQIRWKACKLSGGHNYDNKAVNKCKCIICGFQRHIGYKSGEGWQCERCGGIVKTIPFVAGYPHSIIYFSDCSSEKFLGYDGILSGDEDCV